MHIKVYKVGYVILKRLYFANVIFLWLPKLKKKSTVCFIYILVQILVHSYFELISSILELDATEAVSQTVSQMAFEMINVRMISVQQRI
jgi:hypothetical protein